MGVEVDERKLALQEKNLQVAQTSSGLKTSLNPDWQSDARLRMQIEDSMNTAMFSPQQPLITNGETHMPAIWRDHASGSTRARYPLLAQPERPIGRDACETAG